MAKPEEPRGGKKPETLDLKASHVKVETSGHVTITDPRVAELLQRKTGAGRGVALQDNGVSVGVVVSKSF